MIAETAYPWTLDWDDWTNNIIGLESQLLPGYPASVAGQTAFMQAVRQVLEDVPNGLGRGFFYWEGTWIATSEHDQDGSPWENRRCSISSTSRWTASMRLRRGIISYLRR